MVWVQQKKYGSPLAGCRVRLWMQGLLADLRTSPKKVKKRAVLHAGARAGHRYGGLRVGRNGGSFPESGC